MGWRVWVTQSGYPVALKTALDGNQCLRDDSLDFVVNRYTARRKRRIIIKLITTEFTL